MFNKSLMAASIALASMPALAEESKQIEEVMVEGSYLYSDKVNSVKTPTPILDVPQSLSIISAEQIKLQGFNAVGDIINYTPGVNNSQGEAHRDSVVFRGIRSTADFYIDGVRDDVQYYRPLYNLEQVEILRGPNALLFGRGGTGGVLNRVTKKGVVGESFSNYEVGANSFGGFDAQIDANASVSDNVAIRVNALYESLEGHRDFADGDRVGFNPTAKIQFSDATSLDVSYEYMDHQRFIDRGIPTGADGRPVEAFDEIVFGDADVNNSELTAHLFRANLQHSFSDTLKGNINAFYGDYEKLYENFYASGYDQENSPEVVTLDGYVDTTERQNTILSANLINEFDTGSIGHTLMVGAEYIDTSSDQDRWNAFWDTTQDDNEVFSIARPLNLRGGVGVNAAGQTTTNDFTADINDDTRVQIESSSLYIQDEIKLTEQLNIVLGARYDSFDIEVNNVVAEDVRSRKDDEVSPRAGIIFKPQENISLYASYSESFLPRSGEQYANINGDNDQLAPDVFESQEIGAKWDFANGLSLTAAYFENEQTRADRDNDTGEAFEVRGLTVDGFEVQLQGQVTDQLSIIGGYSFLDGETADNEEPRELPENMASLWGSYQVMDNFGLGLGLIHQDKSLIKDGGDAYLPSFTRVDAMAFYDFSDKLRVQMNIENLTDENYYPNAHSTHQVTVGAPMNASLKLIGKF